MLDTRTSKYYTSKEFYQRNALLHKLPQYKSKIEKLPVGNEEMVQAHFIIPVVIKIVSHQFDIFAFSGRCSGSNRFKIWSKVHV